MNLPRLLIAAPSSGSGKSVIAMGMMAALSTSHQVQGFKVGPDYIDPMYHSIATGRPSRNLDSWMLPSDTVTVIFQQNARQASLSIIEGVMGLYDGFGSDPFSGSSASIAALLQCPVILVIDCAKLSGSAAAIAHGMQTFSDQVNIAGVICNRVASENHAAWLKEAIETHTHIPVLGCVPRLETLQIPERHLGLFTVAENPQAARKFINQTGKIISEFIDLKKLLTIANDAPTLQEIPNVQSKKAAAHIRLAVAQDEAFCFYYEENLDALRHQGAEIIPFSPLTDTQLPENIHGLYFGGGYPELYAQQLSQNQSLCKQILQCCQQKMPVYAECGGLMYLTEGIATDQGSYPLVQTVPGWCSMHQRLQMGYREVTPLQNTILNHKGDKLRGHEFHYSNWPVSDEEKAAYQIARRNKRSTTKLEGYATENILASYVHLHFLQDENLAKNFVHHCVQWQGMRRNNGVSSHD